MSTSPNMVCPSCGTFQPRADICSKCGVVIAKKTGAGKKPTAGPIPKPKPKPGVNPAARPAAKTATSKLPLALIIPAAIIAVIVLGYLVFSGGDETDDSTIETTAPAAPAKTGSEAQIDRIAVVKPGVANELQRSQVQSKLHTLRTQMNLYLVENAQPPSNEEGLQSLVEKGVLTAADITDAWGNAYVYKLEWGEETALEKKYTIFMSSKGPDGITGNADDIGL